MFAKHMHIQAPPVRGAFLRFVQVSCSRCCCRNSGFRFQISENVETVCGKFGKHFCARYNLTANFIGVTFDLGQVAQYIWTLRNTFRRYVILSKFILERSILTFDIAQYTQTLRNTPICCTILSKQQSFVTIIVSSFKFVYVLWSSCQLAAQEGPTELLLAKVKNASGRIGIFSYGV